MLHLLDHGWGSVASLHIYADGDTLKCGKLQSNFCFLDGGPETKVRDQMGIDKVGSSQNETSAHTTHTHT